MTMLLENNKVQRVKSDSKGSITVIGHKLSHRRMARSVAIVVVHRDRELLASASRSNRKLLAETWEKQLFPPLALAGIITQNTKSDQKEFCDISSAKSIENAAKNEQKAAEKRVLLVEHTSTAQQQSTETENTANKRLCGKFSHL